MAKFLIKSITWDGDLYSGKYASENGEDLEILENSFEIKKLSGVNAWYIEHKIKDPKKLHIELKDLSKSDKKELGPSYGITKKVAEDALRDIFGDLACKKWSENMEKFLNDKFLNKKHPYVIELDRTAEDYEDLSTLEGDLVDTISDNSNWLIENFDYSPLDKQAKELVKEIESQNNGQSM